MDLDRLKDETLALINEYSEDSSHRELIPQKPYGELDCGFRLYLAYWNDDAHSTHTVGFMYDSKTDMLYRPSEKENNLISLEAAVDYFKEQLSKIPLITN